MGQGLDFSTSLGAPGPAPHPPPHPDHCSLCLGWEPRCPCGAAFILLSPSSPGQDLGVNRSGVGTVSSTVSGQSLMVVVSSDRQTGPHCGR